MNPLNLSYDPSLSQNQDEEFLMHALQNYPDFDVLEAYNSGMTRDEIQQYLSSEFDQQSKNQYYGNELNPKYMDKYSYFDFKGALESGMTPEEIDQYLKETEEKPKRSKKEKAGRLAAQYGLGVLQGTPAGLAYDIATLPLSSKEAQNIPYRETLGEDLERLMEQKAMGQWDEQDQALYDHIVEQIKDPRKSMENVQTADLSIRNLAEKASGVDLEPEGTLEKAANWAGMIRNPRQLSQLAKNGLSKKDVIKAISPTGTEALRGLGAGAALQLAEDGEFGPIGTLASAVVGDLAAHGISATSKKAASLLTKPKENLAKDVAKVFTSKEKIDLQKEIIQDFRKQGIQADLGSTTGNDLIKWMEARISQSGLAGKELREFKDQMINQVKEQYKELADALGESRFATQFEAGETLRNVMKSIRDNDLSEARNFYKEAEKSIKKDAYVDSRKLYNKINEIESNLKPGALKSGEQRSVLDTMERLKRDITDSEGRPIYAAVKDLINNKIALNDIINYEVQGGTKQLLKTLVSDLDRAIVSYGKENPSFAKNYINANRKFADHAKTFRNKNVDAILLASDPERALSKMNTIQGIKDVQKALSKTPEGKQLFDDLKRYKLDDIIGKKLVDNTTSQAKLGSFSKLLDKGKNKELIREILGPKDFKRLELLQKNAGKLARSAEEYYNASKSGVTAVDAAVVYKALLSLSHLLYGNPWPLMKIGGGLLFAKKIGKLLADPEFLKLTEDAILAYEKGNKQNMMKNFERMKPYILTALEINKDKQ
jgi:hypothetical protein